MVRILSAFDTLSISPETGAVFRRGTHFGYTTRVAGEEVRGTAVVSNVIPGRFLCLAILSPRRNVITTAMVEDGKGRTRVWIKMTMEAMPQNMAVTADDIRRSLNASLRRTLKNLKQFSEGGVPPGDTSDRARVAFRSQGLEPFEIIHFQHLFNVDMETINRYFLEEEDYARMLQELGLEISADLVHMLEMPGIGVPYSSRIGPVPLNGIILVTEVVPSRALNLAVFHSLVSPIPGGANLRFFARENGQTEMQFVEFYQIPDTVECKPADRKKVKAELEKRIAELAHLTEWIAEKRPPRALLEKRHPKALLEKSPIP